MSKEHRYNRFDSITSFGSNVDLTTRTGMPLNQIPARIEVHNDQSTTQSIVLGWKGAASGKAFQIPADSIRVIEDVEVAQIFASGTGTIAEVVAYYRHEGGAVNA